MKFPFFCSVHLGVEVRRNQDYPRTKFGTQLEVPKRRIATFLVEKL